MMVGWGSIVLCAATAVLIAHFLKVVEKRKLNTIRVLTVNYLVAVIVAFFVSGSGSFPVSQITNTPQILLLAFITGLFFITNFFIYSKSVFHNGVGVSVAAMRISLIIPVFLSTLWYLELLTFWQWTGVMLVFLTFFLLLPNREKIFAKIPSEARHPASGRWLLALLFICTGVGDASLKVYEAEFSGLIGKEHFMGIVFTIALLTGLSVIMLRKSWSFTRKELLLGVAIGIPNFYTTIFLIQALERLSGGVVYSAVNVLIVLGGTLLGIIRWGDRLSIRQWAGIFLTLVAVLLLI